MVLRPETNMGGDIFLLFQLRHDARSYLTYTLRAIYILATLWAIILGAFDHFGAPGLRVFRSLTIINLFAVTAVAIPQFSSCIAGERENGTWPLLCITGMRPISICLGKYVAQAYQTISLLLAQLPFLFVCLALGGLLANQVLASVLAMAGYFLFVSALAFFFSVNAHSSREALMLSWITLALLIFLPGLMAWLLSALADELVAVRPWLQYLANFATLCELLGPQSVFSVTFTLTDWTERLPALTAYPAAALILFAAAILALYRSLRRPMEGLRTEQGSGKRKARSRAAADQAVRWYTYRFQLGGGAGHLSRWLATFILIGADLALSLKGMLVLWTCLPLLLLELTVSSGRLFSVEKRDRTLVALYLLQSPMRLLWEKSLALARTVLPWILGPMVMVVIHAEAVFLVALALSLILALTICPIILHLSMSNMTWASTGCLLIASPVLLIVMVVGWFLGPAAGIIAIGLWPDRLRKTVAEL